MRISDEVLAMLPRRYRYDGFDAYAVRNVLLVLIAAAVCLAAAIGGQAQSVYGAVAGTVTDENGAVVPGVRVTVFSLTTALRRETVSNDEGKYNLPCLPPGPYRVTFEREGFAPYDWEPTPVESDRVSVLRVK